MLNCLGTNLAPLKLVVRWVTPNNPTSN
jgi:hypothetical protein